MSAKRWIRRLGSAALAAGALPAALAAQPAPADPPGPPPPATPALAQDIQRALEHDRDILSKGPSQSDRDQAAYRLVARQSDAANQVIRAMLAQANPAVQSAIARAIAQDPTPDPQLIGALSSLLGNPRLTQDAAYALAAYHGTGAAMDSLIGYIRNERRPEAQDLRAAATRALGATVEHSAADLLVALVGDMRQVAIVRQAAGDALVDMTLLRENGSAAAAWQQWWAANRNKSPVQFKADLMDRYKRHHSAPPADMEPMLQDLYRLSAVAERPAIINRTLGSPDPGIRAAGIRLINKFEKGRGLDAGVLTRLRAMISDSAPDVRLEAASVLAGVADKDALMPMLIQLAQEPDPLDRAGLCMQVAQLGDLQALPELLQLLQRDPVLRVSVAAARALGQLGPSLQKDSIRRAQVSGALQQAMNDRGRQPGNAALRAACTEALAQLGEQNLDRVFLSLLNLQESPATRKAALDGLRILGLPRTADAIVGWLPNEPDPDVRMAAFDALAKVGSFTFANTLFNYMTESGEHNPDVRQHARQAFKDLLPTGSIRQLSDWANSDAVRREPDLRLAILLAMKDKQTGDELAATLENIGDAYMHQTPPQSNEAAAYFKQALKYWRGNGAAAVVVQPLIREIMDALLASKNYLEAVQFADDEIARDRGEVVQLMGKLTNQIENLQSASDPQDALRLIQAVDKSKSAAIQPYYDRREAVKAEIESARPRAR